MARGGEGWRGVARGRAGAKRRRDTGWSSAGGCLDNHSLAHNLSATTKEPSPGSKIKIARWSRFSRAAFYFIRRLGQILLRSTLL